MSRIENCLQQLKQQGKKGLVPFVTAGDPDAEFTLKCLHKMVEAGADIIELGVPFSDPMADGPVIQKASERALAAGMNLRGVLTIVEQFRQTNTTTPIVLMGYLNPIEFMGYEAFSQKAAQAGVDGVLTVDIPPEEADELIKAYETYQLDPIFLLSPTSTDKRIERVKQVAKGYIYYVSLKGVTGAGHLELSHVQQKIEQIKQTLDIPIAIGFGVKNAEIAEKIGKIGDAVVVGSALIDCISEANGDEQKALESVFALLNSMRQAMDER